MGEDALRALVEEASRAPDPCASLRALTTLRREVDELERRQVARALAGGRSFADVAHALGVSRQAAHRRYRHLAGTVPPPEPASAQAAPAEAPTRVAIPAPVRLAFALAREEARALGAAKVGTEHLLLGILRAEDGGPAAVLRELGVTLDVARQCAEPTAVEHQIVEDDLPPARREGISRYARSVFEQVLREAVARGEPTVDLDDLLLAALRDGDGGAARTIQALGVDPGAVRERLARV
jgi:hypothetical protein